jgi:DNA-binding IclR family transcriptional regulator
VAVPARIQSVERAAAILQLLAVEDAPTGLAQLAASLGLAKATTHGLVQTLRDVGFVDQDPESGGYLVGAGLLELGSRSVDLNEVRSRALNWTDALAARSGESAHVAVYSAGQVLIAHHVFRPDASVQQVQTGSVHPLHATALGKVLLAYDPRAVRALGTGRLEAFTYRTVTDRSRLLRDLADVRDLGWAASVGEHHPDRAGIAAPVRDRSGHVIAVVGIKGTVDSLCDARHRPRAALATQVVAAGRAISREFGHGRAL